MERTLFIPSGPLRLEARLDPGDGRSAAAILCHPHPRYGGSMDVPLIAALQRALARAGLATIRFNFRGVGASTGASTGGAEETEDALAALDFAREELNPAPERIWLAGYSFGAWVAHRAAAADGGVAGLVLVAPPVALMPFDRLAEIDAPVLAVTGDADTYAPPAALRAAAAKAPRCEVAVLPGCDHFYFGFEDEASARVAAFAAADVAAP